MALKTIYEVEVHDEDFQRFQRQFKEFQTAAKSTPSLLQDIGKSANTASKGTEKLEASLAGAAASGAKLQHDLSQTSDQLSKHNELGRKALDQQPRLGVAYARQAQSWGLLARHSEDFAKNVTTAGTGLLKWTGFAGLLGGALGGGLLGMASAAAGTRKASLGLGVAPGELKSFSTNYANLLNNPEGLLGGVNAALHDPTKSAAFSLLGLNYQQEQAKGAFQASQDVTTAFQHWAQTADPRTRQTLFNAFHLGDLGFDATDAQRLSDPARAAELAKARGLASGDATKTFNLTDEESSAWARLSTQMSRFGEATETATLKGLVPFANWAAKIAGSAADALSKPSDGARGTLLKKGIVPETDNGGFLWRWLWGDNQTQTPASPAAPALPGTSSPLTGKPAGTAANATFLHDYFAKAGLPEGAIAGLLGNGSIESGLDPAAFNPAGGGQGAQGVFQWRGSRIDEFRKMYGHDPRYGTLQEQADFALWELTHTHKGVGDRLKAVGNDAKLAAEITNRDYEVSGSSSAPRVAAAGQYADQFKDRSVTVTVANNTGGNATTTVSQLGGAGQ